MQVQHKADNHTFSVTFTHSWYSVAELRAKKFLPKDFSCNQSHLKGTRATIWREGSTDLIVEGTGRAICGPDDNFSKFIGRKLAMARAIKDHRTKCKKNKRQPILTKEVAAILWRTFFQNCSWRDRPWEPLRPPIKTNLAKPIEAMEKAIESEPLLRAPWIAPNPRKKRQSLKP